ncbi:inositol 1,4,5-trisphosphate receptor-interacting protein-like 1 [Pipra filicauda]|uniref:Inositol 1,4,5-trisphosphate receptor-interacting protein-like 1 n=1 Tax=Pipra filicauda TaxID=649802 RepID=A0A7R5KDJ4_9PASS|nr:inositol 1,4,5-trisphosphate receptor-interacting protein-like 1 [Pipra filicauda]XP_039239741.1 inositol 1,4,5-trisphosphate receptor-interacting protein-like 1 [Pipra filicauda]XP_039239742.1 inositol 1,4,5-trisphosphate receptor-interacting protein-like 1 [Pipra filicauda]
MSPTLVLILALLATHAGLKLDYQMDADMAKQMLERENYLHQQMTQLLQEIEEGSTVMVEDPLLSTPQQHWLFWSPAAAALVLLTGGCWLARRRKRASASCREQESSSSKDKGEKKESSKSKEVNKTVSSHSEKKTKEQESSICKEKGDEQENSRSNKKAKEQVSSRCKGKGDEWQSSSTKDKVNEQEKLKGPRSSFSSLAVPVPSPMDAFKQNLSSTSKQLKELVGDLLGICRMFSKRNFMPELHPATGTSTSETWSIHENSINYRLLVILRPPCGHSFSLGPKEQLPASCSCIRVVLECMCSREQLLGKMWCFLHRSGDQLLSDQDSYLLDTLCTGNYLDVEKVACWVQMLVTSAWLLLPQSRHCQLTVLPSCRSCRFQLTGTPGRQITTEMVFAVQQGSSGAYVSLE